VKETAVVPFILITFLWIIQVIEQPSSFPATIEILASAFQRLLALIREIDNNHRLGRFHLCLSLFNELRGLTATNERIFPRIFYFESKKHSEIMPKFCKFMCVERKHLDPDSPSRVPTFTFHDNYGIKVVRPLFFLIWIMFIFRFFKSTWQGRHDRSGRRWACSCCICCMRSW